jgi:antitoxin (DNA-binding transcriptional repressor) of toxin-antitoxin stability system
MEAAIMQAYPLTEARSHLEELVEAALRGETIIIEAETQSLVQLVPVGRQKKGRKAGSARGLIEVRDDFDAPLEDFAPYENP